MQLITQYLVDAKNSLTVDTWGRGGYFGIHNNKLCMCAHGAIQFASNPEVKRILSPLMKAEDLGDAAIWVQEALREAWASQAHRASGRSCRFRRSRCQR